MKEGLEKDTKKVDSLTVKDGENNSEIGKKKGKEERPPTKVVVRRLPPTMTEEEFLQQIEPLPPVDYKYYVPADSSLSPNSFCRAYLNFINQSDIFIFTQKFDGYVFVDSKGLEYPAVVEFAPFQRIPKQRPGRKKDPKAGTLESDVTYTTFLEKLHAQIQETTSAGSNMKQHFFETNVNSGEDSKVSSTPLLDFLRTRHAERLRVREEKRKKDLERKRAREEQRRSAKKSEEEQAVLKPPVISLKPKTEDERLMEQQTIFLRKLLGLPNPCNSVVQANCSDILYDLSCDSNDSYSVRMAKSSENDQILSRGDISINIKNSFYSNCVNNNPYSSKPKYPCVNQNNEIKAYFANGYWKREMLFSERSKTRKLWKQPESNHESPFKAKVNFYPKPMCNNNCKDMSTNGLNDQFRFKDYNLEKELLDESALEAFPTFEESKLHKLQKSFLKPPLIHTSPIKKESLEDIKMKFQMWSHDVTMKSSLNKKKDSKKNDTTQLKIMKPPSRFIRNGINRMMRENDESRLELIYESILKDDMKDVLSNKTDVITKSGNNDIDYLSDGFKSSVSEVVSKDKNSYSSCNSRFLIPNNLKLPKAFGSGKKMISHNNFSASSNLSKKSETIPIDGLPKAFNSLLKSENQKRNCHQFHRNISVIGSSKGSSSNDNINRKGPPCSIIC